jgi:ParB family chromosome partitioning protein
MTNKITTPKRKMTPAEEMKQGLKSRLQDRGPVVNPDLTDNISNLQSPASILSIIEKEAHEDKDNLSSISIELIDNNPYQPRKLFDSIKINELAESIKMQGLIQPIVIRAVGERFQLVAGERRLRACKQLGFSHIMAIVRNVDDAIMAIIALDENILREDLSDYEIGQAIRNMEHLFKTKQQLAERLGCARNDVYRYTAFFDLPSWVIAKLNVNPKIINRSNAQALKSLINSKDYDEKIYREHIEKAMDFLEVGSLTQSLFIDRIKRMVHEAQDPRRQSLTATKEKYEIDGRKMGTLVHDDQSLVIKIKSSALTEQDVKEIHELITTKITGR